MMTADEYLRCIKKLNPSSHVVIWLDTPDGVPYPKWDDAHSGDKPTIKDCEAVLDDVRAEITKEKDAEIAKAALAEIDLKSIRSIREWIAKQADAPQFIKDYEAQAQTERAKLK
jgi:hypothetical protein